MESNPRLSVYQPNALPLGQAGSRLLRVVGGEYGAVSCALWSLCTLYLHACQVRVTVGDSGLCCCTCVMSIER